VIAFRGGEAIKSARVDLSISGFKITGAIPGLYQGGFIGHRMRKRVRDLITFWIRHIVLGCANPASKSATSALCTGEGDCVYSRPEDSSAILSELLEIYWEGLRKPAPFFPQSSWAYAEAKFNEKDNAAEKARDKFEGSDFSRGEIEDPYIRRCFSSAEALEGTAFGGLAEKIIGPALLHLDIEKLN
jgi:exodeoxyribonuclease V gamma subunit